MIHFLKGSYEIVNVFRDYKYTSFANISEEPLVFPWCHGFGTSRDPQTHCSTNSMKHCPWAQHSKDCTDVNDDDRMPPTQTATLHTNRLWIKQELHMAQQDISLAVLSIVLYKPISISLLVISVLLNHSYNELSLLINYLSIFTTITAFSRRSDWLLSNYKRTVNFVTRPLLAFFC